MLYLDIKLDWNLLLLPRDVPRTGLRIGGALSMPSSADVSYS